MVSAQAIAHGAATLINAIALGKGAAFGVDLWTKAEVTLTDDVKTIRAEITSDPSESTLLIERTVNRVLKRFGVENQYGAKIKTTSNIPVARGLKSSSAAANAIVLATIACLGEELDDLSIVNLGVDAAFDANVTITGAFDDACASYFGGVVVTDNNLRMIVKRLELSEDLMDLTVLFHVPQVKSYTANSDVRRLKSVSSLVNVAYEEVLRGNLWTALSLNGLIYSSVIGLDVSVALDALNAGAEAAGLCGKGPAVTAVVSEGKIDEVRSVLERYEGDIIQARLNIEKAKVLNVS